MNSLDISVDEDGTSQLQVLEDVWCASQIERRLAVEICNGVVDARLIK